MSSELRGAASASSYPNGELRGEVIGKNYELDTLGSDVGVAIDDDDGSHDLELPAVVLQSDGSDLRELHISRDVCPPQKKSCRRISLLARSCVRLLGVGMMLMILVVAVLYWPPWAIEEVEVRSRVMSTLFALALFMVAVEDFVLINKSAVMLLLAAVMWTFLAVGYHPNESDEGYAKLHQELDHGLKDVGEIVLFLLPAMGVVESIDHFDGFVVVTRLIEFLMAGKVERIMPILCILTFFLSSVIDNLTATIVALKILRHMVDDDTIRNECGGVVVMAANAGGAWSPVGDVTTTMLWIQGKITAKKTVVWLLLPSFVSGVLPLLGMWWQMRRRILSSAPDVAMRDRDLGRRSKADASGSKSDKKLEKAPLKEGVGGSDITPSPEVPQSNSAGQITRASVSILVLGIIVILFVPILKISTGLPPYLGMLLALALVWLATDMCLCGRSPADASDLDKNGQSCTHAFGVVEALGKVDLTGLLFFTGVLLAVGALDSAGVMRHYAHYLVKLVGDSPAILCTVLGLSSAVVDNVPLVEATIDMFPEEHVDAPLWQLIALAAGTGGSILSIGSIAGVTLMSMQGVGFLWYARNVCPWAMLGFFMGIGVYQVERFVFASN